MSDEDVDEKLNVLSAEINKLVQEIKALKEDKKAKEETIAALESSLEKLQNDLGTVRREKDQELQEVRDYYAVLNGKFDVLTKTFENENKQLKRRLEELERQNTKPSLRQVGFLLEQEIWRYVLPDEKMETCYILESMEKWLDTNNWKVTGQKAQLRWVNLQTELDWHDEKDKGAIKILQNLPLDYTQLKEVDLEEARKQLKDGDYVADVDKELCEKIIDMIITARRLNSTRA